MIGLIVFFDAIFRDFSNDGPSLMGLIGTPKSGSDRPRPYRGLFGDPPTFLLFFFPNFRLRVLLVLTFGNRIFQ